MVAPILEVEEVVVVVVIMCAAVVVAVAVVQDGNVWDKVNYFF